jgi:hypothetical protein
LVTLFPPAVTCPEATEAATAACVKYCIVAMIPVIVVNTMTGDSVGRVTWRNRCHALAPSSDAASSRLTGTSPSAARKITMVFPMPHKASRVSEGFDQVGSLNHPGPSMPNFLSSVFTGPKPGLST